MTTLRVGLVADPAAPTEVAHALADVGPSDEDQSWSVSVVSEPFTTGSEDLDTATERLRHHRDEEQWDLVVGLTELPVHDREGRPLVVAVDDEQRVAVVSLPALGGVRRHARARRVVRSVVEGMADEGANGDRRVPLPQGRGGARLLLGMVLANRPWLLVPGLKSALVAALATGAVATINSTVWLLAGSLSWWRLAVATAVSIALVVGWLIVDAGLWDRPDDDSPPARQRSRLYNASTVLTLLTGLVICYAALFAVNLAWALFILDPAVMGGYLQSDLGYRDVVVIAWFVASAATVGGGLGSGLDSDEAVHAAAYSKREEDRRNRLRENES